MGEHGPNGERRTARRLGALCVLVLVPLALRLLPVAHGFPENYLPDTHVVNNALGMARDKTLVPPAGRYSTYPYLLSYLLLPVYACEYALGRALGTWSGAGEFGEQALARLELVHLPARLLVALLGALTPWVVLRGTRAAGLCRGAWAAAWLVATGLLHVHFSLQERPWGPLSLFFALAAWPAALHAREGRGKPLLLSCLAAGLAFATHQAGVLAFGLPGAAWLVAPRGWRGAELGRRLRGGLACAAAGLALGVLVGHPYYLVHGAPEASSFATAPEVDVAIGGQAMVLEVRWASLERLTAALVGYDPAVVALGALGLFGALALRGTRPVALFTLAWLAFFLTNQNDHVRYLLPAAVLLAWPAGVAAELLLARRWGALVLAPLLLLPLVQAGRLAVLLRRADTRAVAEALLADLPPGARVAIDRYGPQPPLALASLERAAEWRELGGRERRRVERLLAGVPDEPAGLDAVLLQDVLAFDDRHRAYALAPGPARDGELAAAAGDAGDALRALGVTHVLLVDRRPGDGVPPLLVDDAPALDGRAKPAPAQLLEPTWIVDPSEGRGTREALLPTDMDFPLTALWSVARPGPRMVLAPLAP